MQRFVRCKLCYRIFARCWHRTYSEFCRRSALWTPRTIVLSDNRPGDTGVTVGISAIEFIFIVEPNDDCKGGRRRGSPFGDLFWPNTCASNRASSPSTPFVFVRHSRADHGLPRFPAALRYRANAARPRRASARSAPPMAQKKPSCRNADYSGQS
jgi:hypothetical protein